MRKGRQIHPDRVKSSQYFWKKSAEKVRDMSGEARQRKEYTVSLILEEYMPRLPEQN